MHPGVVSGGLAQLVRRYAAIAFALGLGGCQVAAQLPPATGGRSFPTSSRSVMVQLFEWRWADIAQECEAWLGPLGYGAVQISPPHEHRVIDEGPNAFPWYQRYERVSYKLSSRSGDRSELANMVNRCHRAGVKVYADVVINHIASAGAYQGSEGSKFDTSQSSAVPYDPGDFNGTCTIELSDDREEPSCQLLNKQDLETDSEKVQTEIAAAMNELLAIGVAGFHINAAEQISPDHLAKILRQLKPLNPKFHGHGARPFIYQEVARKGAEPIQSSAYFTHGAVTEFGYGRHLGEQVRYGQLKNLVLFGEAWGLMPSHKAVVFTDNHVTQRSRDRNIVTFFAPPDNGARYRLANIFMLAWPYGTPRVMSSYDWTREVGTAAGPPADDQGNTLPVSCGDGWVCEHRWPQIANMVEFRNVTQGASTVEHWWDNGNNQIAFARGQRGFVAINNEDTVLEATLMTGLSAGVYCNILAEPMLDMVDSEVTMEPNSLSPGCDTEIIEVDSLGNAQITVQPYQALAIHIGAQL
ncbi:MAG: alpha amylase C-terminal domain-containing protein [Cyanobacteria bacterium P01_D01_bin.156]